jgi:hypothetical protein
MRNSELTKGSDNRFANALDCALRKLRQRFQLKTPPWGQLKWERDPWIVLKKTFFAVTARKFRHAAKDKDEWTRVSRENLHAVFADRINVPRMDPANGTLKLHMVLGTLLEHGERLIVASMGEDMTPSADLVTKTCKLKLASMSCACKACGGEAGHQETCFFQKIRNEREA